MQLQGQAQRVTIYIGESDQYRGKPLAMALLEFLKQAGAAGATVTRGLAGFGAHSRIHTASIIDLSTDLPVKVEWIDQADLVERLLPQLRQMVNDGLITVETVEVIQYAPGRQPDPLAQPVHNIMRTEVLTVQPDTPVQQVVTLLVQRGYRSLPVVTDDRKLLGIITDGDLLRHTQLATRLDLLPTLSTPQIQQQLSALQQQRQQAADIMTQPVITVTADDPVRVAMACMADRHLKRLPVVDTAGHLVGLISRVDILRALEYHHKGQEAESDLPHTGTTVAELMYQDVPTVGPQARLDEIIQALETNLRRRVIVVDEQRRVLGIITDGDLLRRSEHAQHPDLLNRLRNLITGQQPSEVRIPASNETAAHLMTAPVITLHPDTPLNEALRLMIQHHIKRLPVVDEQGRLIGLLGRASLLRGLMGNATGQVDE
jgi:CBS domain-containing protein